jgi:hypothetical protein
MEDQSYTAAAAGFVAVLVATFGLWLLLTA